MLKTLWISVVAVAAIAIMSLSIPSQAAPPQSKGPKNSGAIAGVVVDGNGAPVGGASVLLFDGVAMDQVAEDFTNASGEFSFTRLSPGDYSVTAFALCCGAGNASVTVTGGQTTNVTITLD